MPRLTSLSGAQVAVLFDDPLGIVEFDEVADGVPQLRDVAVDATMDDLFLQRAIEPLGDAVGLGLGDEGVGRLDAPELVYLSGTNTRRVKRALFGLFRGAVSKDVVSRAWRKVKVDWDAWCSRGLADEDIVRLILDGTVIKTRLDRKATNISVLAAIGVRRDGQKVLLSIGNMGGESQAAWRQFLDDLDARGLKRPGFVIVDGAPGLEAALSALWGDDLPVQRCTVHSTATFWVMLPNTCMTS